MVNVTRLELCQIAEALRDKANDMEDIVRYSDKLGGVFASADFIRYNTQAAKERRELADKIMMAVEGYSPAIGIIAGG